MPEIKYDSRGIEKWEEIAQEVFTHLVSREHPYGGGGLISAEVIHHIPGCMLFLDYFLDSKEQAVCRVHLKYKSDYDRLHLVGTTVMRRQQPQKRDYHPKARRVETPLC